VEQLSLPYRIGLVVLLVVGGLWFAVLRPKAGGEPTPAVTTAPGVTGLAKDVATAKGAVDASNASAARNESAANAVGQDASTATSTTGTTTAAKGATKATTAVKPATAKPAKPGLADDAASGDPSRPLLAAVDAGKVAVVLFWNSKGADDRATRSALRAIDLHHGKVKAAAVPVRDVGKYEAITRGAQILESPTVLVIGAGGKAREITGYTQASEIDQAVTDIGGKGFEATKAFQLTGFAKVADDACRDFTFELDQKTDLPTTSKALISYFDMGAGELHKTHARLQRATAKGATNRALKASLLTFTSRDAALAATASKQLAAGTSAATVVDAFYTSETAAQKPLTAAAKKARARGCQS
jgi:hypothetical protein